VHTWPRQSEQWIYRHRPGQWPTDILINEIVNYGCILVPIGPKEIDNNDLKIDICIHHHPQLSTLI
jgi:hypothetical protein